MASFPNAIKQFITKIAHTDRVQSADINALQEEVGAIETTLLSGTEGQVLTSGSAGIPTWGEGNSASGYPFIPILSDWSIADNVINDIKEATGIVNFPTGYTDTDIRLLHISGSSTSYNTLYSRNGGSSWGLGSWSDYVPDFGSGIILSMTLSMSW